MVVRLIGCGAVGAPVAARIKDSCDFALIVDDERKKKYEGGIYLNSRKYLLSLETKSDATKADLIIAAIKNFDLYPALDEIAPFVKDDTTIMSLLNGIDAESVLASRFGEEKVICSFITDLSSNHSGIETVCFSEGGTIVFGEKDGFLSERVLRIKELFDASGQRYRIAEDIRHEKWWKLMLNTCFNTLSAILDADYAAISENVSFIRAVRLVAREVSEVANAEGVRITQCDIESMIARMATLKDHGRTSMLQDVDAGRQTENDYFAGAVSRLAHQHGIPSPNVDMIHILLEARRSVLRLTI